MTGRPVLIVGVARSGTTWVGRALGQCAGARYVHEPDNETVQPFAIAAKQGLGRYPLLQDADEPPPAYRALWTGAFAGGAERQDTRDRTSRLLHRWVRGSAAFADGSRAQRAGRAVAARLAEPLRPFDGGGRVIVKSVHAGLILDWLLTGWAPTTLYVAKQPLNLVASWHRLGWRPPFDRHPVLSVHDPRRVLADRLPDAVPAQPADDLGRLTWQLVVLDLAMRAQLDRQPAVHVVPHEALCDSPVDRFRELAAELGLSWSSAVADYLTASDVEGVGRYDTSRSAAAEPDAWRRRLHGDDADRIRDVLAAFPVGP